MSRRADDAKPNVLFSRLFVLLVTLKVIVVLFDLDGENDVSVVTDFILGGFVALMSFSASLSLWRNVCWYRSETRLYEIMQ